MEYLEYMSVEDLKDFLEEKGICESVLSNFESNMISGKNFLELTEEEIKELAPQIGIRADIRRILREYNEKTVDKTAKSSVTETLTDTLTTPSTSTPTPVTSTPTPGYAPTTPRTTVQNFEKDWFEKFQIPEKASFSGAVQKAIESGVISARARQEIIHTVRTLMLQHTRVPTSEVYTTICQKLIIKYPKLRDTLGSNGYGSWKQSLRNSFKNFRRDHPIDENSPPSREKGPCPPSKRLKPIEDVSECSKEDYEEAVTVLKKEWKRGRKGQNQAKMHDLMKKTAGPRRHWITTERPMISEVLREFPMLLDSRVLQREFQSVTGIGDLKCVKDEWPNWIKKIRGVGEVEGITRKTISVLVKRIDEASENDERDNITVQLLMKLLYPRGVSKYIFLKHFETCDIDLDEEIDGISQTEPYIVITGKPGEENAQFFICGEKTIIGECKTLYDALINLICTYYVFDILYPKPLLGLFLFFQQNVLSIKDSQTLPSYLSKFLQNMSALDI